jgi:ATP-dependent RNA helicase DDX60
MTLCWHLHGLMVSLMSIFCMRYRICLRLYNLIDPSFQTLHAIHSMERLLNEMIRRSAVFDVVFWEGKFKSIARMPIRGFIHLFPGTRHLTLKGGTDLFVSSRSLARALLFSHLIEHSSEMGLEIYAFSSLTDPAWHAYQQRTRVKF